MRPALSLLVLLLVATLPALSQAAAPNVLLLHCDTLSVSPLQVRFEFGLQNSGPNSGGYYAFSLFPTDGSHILTCSTTVPGALCYGIDAPNFGAVWQLNMTTVAGQSIQSLVFVSDHGAPCYVGITYGPPFDEATSQQSLCFSCLGIQATPTQSSTWGKVKAFYR